MDDVNNHANEYDSLIDKKTKSHGNNEEYQRRWPWQDWSGASWIRWLNVLCWWWVNPILSLGYKRVLTQDDLDDLPHADKCASLLNKIRNADWEKKTTWNIIIQVFWRQFLSTGLMFILYTATRIAQPLLLRQIALFIQEYQNNALKSSSATGYSCAVALFACTLVQVFLYQQIFFRNSRLGLSIRNSLVSVIYTRLLSINTASVQQVTAAHTINLIGNDAAKFDEFTMFFHYLWVAPLEAITMFGLIWWIIGFWPTLFGYSIYFLLIPIQIGFGRLFSRYCETLMEWTDKRVHLFDELINGSHIIKMYGWEQPMVKRVLEMRKHEFASIQSASRLRAFNQGIFFGSLPVIALAAFGGAWLLGYQLKAVDIFTALTFYGQMRLPLVLLLPTAIEKVNEIQVAVKRIDAFIRLTTRQQLQTSSQLQNDQKQPKGTIFLRDASFSWNDHETCLSSLNVNIESGTFVGIVGPVGAGKSSFLAAILGEMNMVGGQRDVNGSSFTYVPQSAWIFADTLRANILFGKPLDQSRYSSVLRACCLDVDLGVFGENGDMIIIGEKGVNLSGGQRARVALARALYADADIYLLDDPLAAVDARVAEKIYDQCIGPHGLLSHKTRLLVTHQTQYLINADQRIIMDHGCIQIQDSINRVSLTYENIDHKDDESNQEDVDLTSLLDIVGQPTADTRSIITDEISIDGTVSWSIWLKLFTAPPMGWFGLFLLIFIFFSCEVLYDGSNIWLWHWSSLSYADQRRLTIFAFIYLVFVLMTLIVAVVRANYFFYLMLNGSNSLHSNMLTALVYTCIGFFESNPGGRILNRASTDQRVIDELLPMTLFDALQTLIMTAGTVVVIGIINPWVLMLLIPLVPAFWYLRRFYLESSRQIKRLESVTRSPVYALFASSLDGLGTIRAFGVEDDFIQLFTSKIDANTRPYIIMMAAAHWFGLRLEIMSALFAFATAILAVAFRNTLNPTAVALSLMYCINMTAYFQWTCSKMCVVKINYLGHLVHNY